MEGEIECIYYIISDSIIYNLKFNYSNYDKSTI